MRKFMVTLIFLALMCAGAYAANLTIRAFDVVTSAELDWNLGTGAEIYFNGFPTGHQTPHVFVNYPSGDYSVQRTGYIDWLPVAVTFNATSANVSFSFYGVPTVFTPVTLNSFTSAFDANAQGVKLTWVSQSEIIMLGYRLYRSETPVQADAVLITPTMIEASNSSDVTIYHHTDVEIEAGHTYYYWLESVDMVGSQFFNPVTIRIEDHSTETPVITPSLSGGPNPFKAGTSTNLYYSVKAGETGTLTVYNILGQVVKTHQVTEGSNQLIKWDGRDSKGNVCASGVYFYKLSTPSLNETRKLVIVD